VTTGQAATVDQGGADQGGVAPLALRAHPPGYFRPDEGGAGFSAPLLLRGALALAGLWLAVRLLPSMPGPFAALLALALTAAVALPQAWAGAVRRGHLLRELTAGSWLLGLLSGAALRVAVAGTLGMVAAVLALLRLAEAGAAFWALAVLALPLTWGLMALLGPRLAAAFSGLHAHRRTHAWARVGAVAVLLALALAIGLAAPPPAPAPLEGPPAASPLVAEALGLARLWAGLEAFVLGQAAEFGAWGRGLAGLVAAGALAGVFWAMASLAVALTLPRAEVRRALAPASDASLPPAVGRIGPAMALLLAAVTLAGVVVSGSWLAGLPPEARPTARAQVAVEEIEGVLYAAGTMERITALRTTILAEDEGARASLRQSLEAGFDAMAGNVDPFLDDFYSLSGEYGRLWYWATQRLESHLTNQLTGALQAGAPFAEFEAMQARLIGESEARGQELATAQEAILAAARIEGANPARLRISARHGALPLPPAFLAADLRRAQERWAIAGGSGVVALVMAQRVAGRLAARGVLAVAARMVARVGGLLLAFGLDYALVKLDEYQNRDDFRAEILSQIEAQRAEALAALNAVQR